MAWPGIVDPIFRTEATRRAYRQIKQKYGRHSSAFRSSVDYLADMSAEARELRALLGPRYWTLPGFAFFHRSVIREPAPRRGGRVPRGGPRLGRSA